MHKPSLFFWDNYKEMLLLCCLDLNWILNLNFALRWLAVTGHVMWMHYADWLLFVNKRILAGATCITHVRWELCIKHVQQDESYEDYAIPTPWRVFIYHMHDTFVVNEHINFFALNLGSQFSSAAVSANSSWYSIQGLIVLISDSF